MLLTFPLDRVRQPGTGKAPSRLERQVVAFTPKAEPVEVPVVTRAHRETLAAQMAALTPQPQTPSTYTVFDNGLDGLEPSTAQAPMVKLREDVVRDLIIKAIKRYEAGTNPQLIAHTLVRFIGANSLHPKLGYAMPSLYYHLRVLTGIYVELDGKYPVRLIERIRDTLIERQRA